MDSIQSVQWLKANGLYEAAEDTSFQLKKIFNPCFKVTDEKILIIGDIGSNKKRIAPILSGAYFLAAKSLNMDTKLVLQDATTRGDVASGEIIDALSGLEEKNLVFLNMSDKLGSIGDLGKSFRKFCEKKKHRFVSALSLGDLDSEKLSDVVAAIDVDYKPLIEKHAIVKKILDDAKEIHVKTPAGTDLYYNVEGMQAVSADGNYQEPGKGGNLPAGEVYIPCNGRKVEGTVVIDGSSRNKKHTSLINNPITIRIKEGSITSIEGKEEAEALKESLKWAAESSKHPNGVYRIGELGIGLNPRAKIIGSTLVDEKTLGTAHIAIGSNYWFGGSIYSLIHLDQIFRKPEITIDGKKIDI